MKNNPSSNPVKAWGEWLIRILIGIMFAYAGWQKLLDPDGFARIIYGYGLFPGIIINASAIVVPMLEMVAGGCLIFGVAPRSAVWILNGLLLVFIAAITINMMRGYEFDCGCFGTGTSPSSHVALLVRDLIAFVAGVLVFKYQGRRKLCVWDQGCHGDS